MAPPQEKSLLTTDVAPHSVSYLQNPDCLREILVYNLTIEVQKRVQASRLSRGEITPSELGRGSAALQRGVRRK